MGQLAWIYCRFSTLDQGDGDSLKRQLEGARSFIEAEGWDYSPDREMIDEGKSAFHSVNRMDGAQLYQFEKKAIAGHFDNGAVLVVENTDRLTRAGYEAAFDIIRAFTGRGVTVATWSPRQVYPAHARIDMGQAMRLIVEAELALAESEKKSTRLKGAWKTKIEAAEAGSGSVATSIVPGWLDVTITGRRPDLQRTVTSNAHRVAILNEIFDWYCDGKGLPWIERALNERNEPTWGRGKHADANGWNVATLHKYLTSRTVLGEYEPKGRAGKSLKVSKGILIPDYYPQVITPDKFNRVQALRVERQRWSARADDTFPNLFTNLAKCFHCGGTLKQNGISRPGTVVVNKNKNGTTRSHVIKTQRSYLKCTNALRGMGCTNKRGFRYEPLEAGIIDVVVHWMTQQRDFTPNSRIGQLITSLAEQERQVRIKEAKLAQTVENLTEVFSKALAQSASDLEMKIEADREQIERTQRELEIARGTASPEESVAVLTATKNDLNSEDQQVAYAARVKANQSLRRVVKHMDGDESGHINVLTINDLYLRFNPEGECVEATPAADANVIYTGPNGEIDWHPDEPDAEYQYAE